jgi:FkbM family methyltransferase
VCLVNRKEAENKEEICAEDRHGALVISILGMKGQNLLRVISSMRLRRTQSICQGLIRPSLNVFWVEPIPDVYEILCQNIRDLPRQRAAQALLLDRDGVKVKLNIANNEGASSSVMSLKKHQELWPSVAYVDAIELLSSTLVTLVDQCQLCLDDYDSLVLDTQGSELLILKGSVPLLSKIN